jgi:hypothetical protein
MLRCAAGLFCALLVVAASAAPAPLPKPWFGMEGWDMPLGNGRFRRAGEKVIVTVAGKGRDGAPAKDLSAARLLRDVEGDFAVQVRIRGDFRPAPATAERKARPQLGLFRRAGILIADGEGFAGVQRAGALSSPSPTYHFWCGAHIDGKFTRRDIHPVSGPPRGPTYIRVERWDNDLGVSLSGDGNTWEPTVLQPIKLPKKVKVGLIAEATDSGTFEAVFDQFTLTKPKG